MGDTRNYCLVHLLLHRDIGCVEGLGNLNGVCKGNSNLAWSKVHPDDDDQTINTIAHEVGHNFGSEHDGGNSSTYRGCNTPETKGIMGGLQTNKFSTCSLSAMHARLQQVLKAEEEKSHCLTRGEEARQTAGNATILITESVTYLDKVSSDTHTRQSECNIERI